MNHHSHTTSDPRTSQQLLRQVAGAFLWAIFFIFAPTEVLVLGALGWIPLLIWRERVRTVRYGFLPGAVARLSVIAFVITIAALVPIKHEDGRVGPLSHADISLGELAADGVIYPLNDQRHDSVRVVLPSTAPTRREVMQAISQQTEFKTSIFHCGNGATILFGSGGGRIKVSKNQEKPDQARQ